MNSYTFVWRCRQAGAIGGFGERRAVSVVADTFHDAVMRAGVQFGIQHPGFERSVPAAVYRDGDQVDVVKERLRESPEV